MSRFFMVLRAAVGAAALLVSNVAFASPFQVDSTGTAEDIEMKTTFEYRDTASKRTLIAPKWAMVFPVMGNLEFEVGTGYRRVEDNGDSNAGLADSTLQLKWRVADETPRRPGFALIPELTLPTGSGKRGLGAGHAALVVPMVVEKHVGAVMLSGQFGYGRSFGHDEDFIPFGVLVTSEPFETFKIGMELAGEASRDHFSDCELSTNIGFKWKATSRMEIHGLVGRTVRSPDSDPMTRSKLVMELHL